jgi:hypothetical protein
METNYELKHKCLLVPLKAVLLVIVMVLVGFTTYAQQGKAVKVTNDEQLIEAMENHSIGTIELEAGYYTYLNTYAESGTKVVKQIDNSGNRNLQCTYFIIGQNVCFTDPNPAGFVLSIARAGFSDDNIPPCNCCPPDASNLGVWTVTDKPYGSTVNFLLGPPFNLQVMPFEVDMPGAYLLRYTWPSPYNSLVETQYYFYGPYTVNLSAPDVCGTSTMVDFELLSDFPDPGTTVVWTLDGEPYAGPTTTGQFLLEVPTCGYYELSVTVTPTRCPPITRTIWIDFSCDPVADAGPDINVCNALCYYSLYGSTGLYTFSPDHAWSWNQLSGPGTLAFNQQYEEETGVCATDPICAYGEYEVQFSVQNGMCYGEKEMFLRFYELPTAIAGPDQYICDNFSYTLAAVPYPYCGEEGVNYWKHAWWELVSQPDDDCTVTFDMFDPATVVTVSGCDFEDCAYGEYVFVWHELNVKIDPLTGDTLWAELNCYASDEVVVTIFETPEIYAGADMVFCNTWAFSLYGIGDAPCYENTVVVYSWEKTEWPGNCKIQFETAGMLQPIITISDCGEECPYGEYIFTLTQSNGYYDNNQNFVAVCETSDDVSVWIFEEPNANAGLDQNICADFAFTLGAVPSEFCGEEDVNYFTWGEWEFVSGPGGDVTIDDVNDPMSGVSIDVDGVECPYGDYIFMWTEYNGFGTPFQGCEDVDYVTITVFPTPEPDAGDDAAYCETSIKREGDFMFALDGATDLECIGDLAYTYFWTVVSQPDLCTIEFTGDALDPMVTISDCSTCPYGDYVFSLTQQNGYFDVTGAFVMVCEGVAEVTVTIYEQPEGVSAGADLLLCNDFEFDLTAVGYDYGCTDDNWYSWTLVSQPEGIECEVTITNGTELTASVSIENCVGECAYGEYVFRFTEYNGDEEVYCEDWDEVSVFIFEMPEADAGDDIQACVNINDEPYCYSMTATLDYCYSMYGLWTKSCGPGEVLFSDIHSPVSDACFEEPGRYVFTWTVWNAAEGCEDAADVTFDLLEQPTAAGNDEPVIADCDVLCYSLYDAGIVKYEYFGTDAGECPNYQDFSHWSYVDGPTGDPAEVTFADDTDPATEMCVSTYGCYTVRWNEINRSVDGDFECADYFDVFVVFVETPTPDAGDDASICGNCYTMTALPYTAENCLPGLSESYWMFYSYEPPVDPCPTDGFAPEYTPCFTVSDLNDPNAMICVCDDCVGEHYGTYGFIWVNASGFCIGYDTVYIEFKKIPEPVALEGLFDPSNCAGVSNNEWDCPDCAVECLWPEDRVIEVCAESSLEWSIDWDCSCYGMPIPGYTYEWSFIGPSGSYMTADPYWYDCAEECWKGSDNVYIYFGECCDTARLYLTITTPQGCETTEEWKFYVNHKPCANIEGPEVSEVGSLTTYCNICPEEYDMNCLLYTWTAEHCGHIVSGQGTECIEVLWTDYNVNGGWGEITMTVFDTCTGCCNYDEMMVKIYPTGTLGNATLSGYVYYQNNFLTPLNGVEVQLWNGGIPVMSTLSFTDVEGGNGVGYYEFAGISGSTNFGITASYNAPWYGANATDALAVELRVINSLPGGFFVNQPLQEEAMDVNNISNITATDALWIKQRAINMVNYFPAGNWAFEPGMSSMAGTYNIMTLNMGDANRSNVPNSTKSAPAIALVNDGTMNVVNGQVFELPIRIANADQFGAITLTLEYNSELLEVVEVVSMEGMLDNVTDGNVSIAWSNVNPMVLAENDVVMTLKVKAIGEISATESLFSIGMGSEFADQSASVIEPVTLKTFGITTEPAAADYFLSTNRPNPFNNSTFIEYTMPETGKVRLSVLDMLGQEIAVLVDATQSAGSYTVEFSAAGLATGVYIYKITVDGESRDFISTQRMVISH